MFVRESVPGPGWDWLVMEFQGTAVVYSATSGYQAQEVQELFRRRPVGSISGKEELLVPLLPYFPRWSLSRSFLCRLAEPPQGGLAPLPFRGSLRPLGPGDVPQLIDLFCCLPEWRDQYLHRRQEAVAQRRRALEQGDRIWGLWVEDRLVATAAATACGRRCAMIVGVATLEPWRRQGCAAHLVSRLCQELQGQGRDLVCLFYQTPQAGRVYQRLGFVPVGRYGLLNPSP